VMDSARGICGGGPMPSIEEFTYQVHDNNDSRPLSSDVVNEVQTESVLPKVLEAPNKKRVTKISKNIFH
jgi:hypothetical protein